MDPQEDITYNLKTTSGHFVLQCSRRKTLDLDVACGDHRDLMLAVLSQDAVLCHYCAPALL